MSRPGIVFYLQEEEHTALRVLRRVLLHALSIALYASLSRKSGGLGIKDDNGHSDVQGLWEVHPVLEVQLMR